MATAVIIFPGYVFTMFSGFGLSMLNAQVSTPYMACSGKPFLMLIMIFHSLYTSWFIYITAGSLTSAWALQV